MIPARPSSDVDALAGKTVALVGLPADEIADLVHALELAHALPCVLNAGDSVQMPTSGPLFDVVAIDASLDWDAEGADMPVLFIGNPLSIRRWTPALHDQTHDFQIAPCNPDEFLLRAGRLAATH
jgi:hypothetical protein